MCINGRCFHCVNHVTVLCAIITLTALSFTFCREVLAEPLQTDDTGSLVNEDKLIDLQHSELLEERPCSESEEDIEILERSHEDPTGQSEEPEMCKDLDQNVDPKQSEVTEDNVEVLIQAADNAETIENSQEVPELTVKLEETSCLQHKDCDQTTPQKLSPQPEDFKQLELTEEPEQIRAEVLDQAEERHSEDQLGQQQHLEQSPQMELAEESTQPENADLPEECTRSEQTICVEAEHPGVAEKQEQTEPSEQKEQMTDLSQTALSGQLVRPEETDESKIMEQLSAETEATQQTLEAEVNQVDKQAETSHQAEEVGGSEGGSVQTVVANGTQPKPLETAVPHMNGCEVDREMARRLAERLFKLDGIQRVDVVKHLDKE